MIDLAEANKWDAPKVADPGRVSDTVAPTDLNVKPEDLTTVPEAIQVEGHDTWVLV